MALFVQHPEKIPTAGGMTVILGIMVSLLGVIACGRAGILRSRGTGEDSEASRDRKVMVKGLLICFLGGVLCSCLNYAFSFGDSILKASIENSSLRQFALAYSRAGSVIGRPPLQ